MEPWRRIARECNRKTARELGVGLGEKFIINGTYSHTEDDFPFYYQIDINCGALYSYNPYFPLCDWKPSYDVYLAMEDRKLEITKFFDMSKAEIEERRKLINKYI